MLKSAKGLFFNEHACTKKNVTLIAVYYAQKAQAMKKYSRESEEQFLQSVPVHESQSNNEAESRERKQFRLSFQSLCRLLVQFIKRENIKETGKYIFVSENGRL